MKIKWQIDVPNVKTLLMDLIKLSEVLKGRIAV
jgi:hypothetical protein